jgi:predicted DCC family thiol-disulfide oxidoreductase YuxK
MSDASPLKNYLLWDGDCGFCEWSVGKFRKFLNQDLIELLPYQRANIEICPEDIKEKCSRAIQLRTIEGLYFSDIHAIAKCLNLSGYNSISKVIEWSPIYFVLKKMYYFIAKHRGFLSKILGKKVCGWH